MHEENSAAPLSPKAMLCRFGILLAASLAVGLGGGLTVLESHQATACAVSASSSGPFSSGDSGWRSRFWDWRF